MPAVDPEEYTIGAPRVAERDVRRDPTTGEIFGAAFRMENDVVNAYDLMTRRFDTEPEAGFDLTSRLKQHDQENGTRLWEDYRENFLGTNNSAEFRRRVNRIERELKDRQIEDAGGWTGFLARMTAGALSPTMFLPLIGPSAKGVQAVRQGAALGAAGIAAQEVPLQLAQETRTAEETAAGVIGGAALGGALGGAVGWWRMRPDGRVPVPGAMTPVKVTDDGKISGAIVKGTAVPTTDVVVEVTVPPVKIYTTRDLGLNPPANDDRVIIDDWKNRRFDRKTVETIERQEFLDLVAKQTGEQYPQQGDVPAFVVVQKTKDVVKDRRVVLENIPDYQTGIPTYVDAFHGTDRVFGKFGREFLGETTGANSARRGFFFARDPKTTETYSLTGRSGENSAPNTVMARLRFDNPFVADWAGLSTRRRGLTQMLDEAIAAGHDGVIVKNVLDGGDVDVIYVSFDENKIGVRFNKAVYDMKTRLETVTQPRPAILRPANDISNGKVPPVPAETVVSALVGRGYPNMTPDELQTALAAVEADAAALRENGMANSVTETAIPSSSRALSAGAAAVDRGVTGAGGLAPTVGGNKSTVNTLARIGPVTDTARMADPEIVKLTDGTEYSYFWTTPVEIMNQLADAGTKRINNYLGRATAEGGTVENRQKFYYGLYYKATKVIDEAYLEHVFEQSRPDRFAGPRAMVSGWLSPDKMSRQQFRRAIGAGLFEPEPNPNPVIRRAVDQIRNQFYDAIKAEMKAAGKEDEFFKTIGDAFYANRVWDTDVISRYEGLFVQMLADKFADKYHADALDEILALAEREKLTREAIDDLTAPASVVRRRTEELTTRRRDIRDQMDDDELEIDDTITALRSDLYEARRAETRDPDLINSLKQQIKDLEQTGGEWLKGVQGERSVIRRRLANLNKSRAVYERRQMVKLERVLDLEDMSQTSLERLTKAIERLDAKLEQYSPKEIQNEIDRLTVLFRAAEQRYDAAEARLARAREEEPELNKLFAADALLTRRATSMSEYAAQIQRIEESDPELIRATLRLAKDDVYQRTLELIQRRAIRQERLIAQAENYDPKLVDARVEKLRDRVKEARLELADRLRQRGADDADVVGAMKGAERGVVPGPAVVDFRRKALEDARMISQKIRGAAVRLAEIDLLQGDRGPQLRRMLDFPTADFMNVKLPSGEIVNFVESDVEKMMRAYIRTVGPDIEMLKKFGSPNAETQLDAIISEAQQKKTELWDLREAGKLSDEEYTRLADRVTADERRAAENVRGVIERLRHTRGMPKDPYAWDYRMGRFMLNLSTTVYMGGVLLSSLPDLARPMMKYGMLRTFEDAIVPFITNLKEFKELTAEEAKLAGTALDPIIHSRAHAISDAIDDFSRYSRFERGMEFLANKTGIVALFDYWTAVMKELTVSVVIPHANNALRIVAGGEQTSAAEVRKATEWLAENGIDGEAAQRIWSQLTAAGGGDKVNGVWFPNTESWTDPEAVRIYRQMIARNADDTIVTPGAERPLWMDKSMPARLLGQFKSYVMGSTTKVLMANMQQKDMAVITGALTSLALGALSYYTWAVATGGRNYEEMMKADAGKWTDEALNRSGLLAVFGLVQDGFSRIPATRPYVTFSDQQTIRRGGDDLVDFVLGPSAGVLQNVARAISGLDDPTQATINSASKLLPYNNLFYFRQLLDAVENAAGDALNLPDRRK